MIQKISYTCTSVVAMMEACNYSIAIHKISNEIEKRTMLWVKWVKKVNCDHKNLAIYDHVTARLSKWFKLKKVTLCFKYFASWRNKLLIVIRNLDTFMYRGGFWIRSPLDIACSHLHILIYPLGTTVSFNSQYLQNQFHLEFGSLFINLIFSLVTWKRRWVISEHFL